MNFETLIQIAADGVDRLRRCDVFRVVSECPIEHRDRLVAWLSQRRPDLSGEAADCLAECRAIPK